MKQFEENILDEEQDLDNEIPQKMPKQFKDYIKDLCSLLFSILIAYLLAIIVITFIGTFSIVNGKSMENTLYHGEHLWIDKLSYIFSKPERFDIVIFPHLNSDNKEVFYIKRIIGLPGESIKIDSSGNILIDGKVLEEDFGKEAITSDKLGRANKEILLGADEYFVLGDNRNHSGDSRYSDVGNVLGKEIVGKAVLKVWPLNKFSTIK